MVILGLGSNIGDRLANLRAAQAELSLFLSDIQASSIYESKALLPEGAPKNWNDVFLNMVICGGCEVAPEELLTMVKTIEKKLGRQDRGHWAPREIDIDILAIDDLVLKTDMLSIPHPEIANRDFVLLPMAEIVPDWLHPQYKVTAQDMLQEKAYSLGEHLQVLHG